MPGPGAPGRGRGPTPDAVLALPEPARRMTALPVTSLYAALSGLLLLALSLLVIRARLAARVALGLGEDVRLLRASRAQGNFTEYAPLTLLLLLLLEAAGSGPALLHLLGGLALAGRVLHAIGISREPETLILRQAGMALTFAVLGLAAPLLLLRLAAG
ncbi:MAPEG family protein [Teichococcus aestuarii]|nr:MAPEG family protein [Pseudoroseomonas aestuarii]